MLTSAGILAYRFNEGELEFFLAHPGGPFFAKKDQGWWTIPKGLIQDGEDALVAARREFLEEIGVEPTGDFISLGYITQKGGKKVHGFGLAFNVEASTIQSNTFETEWPPQSGRYAAFPEVDQAAWFNLQVARLKLNERQVAFLDRLMLHLGLLK